MKGFAGCCRKAKSCQMPNTTECHKTYHTITLCLCHFYLLCFFCVVVVDVVGRFVSPPTALCYCCQTTTTNNREIWIMFNSVTRNVISHNNHKNHEKLCSCIINACENTFHLSFHSHLLLLQRASVSTLIIISCAQLNRIKFQNDQTNVESSTF